MDIRLFFIYVAIMAGSTYLIRAIPFVAVKNKIKNPYIKAFLTYIPYAVLTAMTIPAILYSTGYIASAVVGFIVAVLFSVRGFGLMPVAIAACAAVYLTELCLTYLV